MTSTELDRIDPPSRRRPPRPEVGPEEAGVRLDLKALGQSAKGRRGALAAQALATAQEIDRGDFQGRDRVAARAQVRQCIVQLREWNPAPEQGDATDAARAQVEQAQALYAVPEAG